MADLKERELRITPAEHGNRRVELLLDGESISRCTIIPYTLRVGAAEVRMDGIGSVGTEAAHRMKGHAAKIMRAAVQDMQQRDAAVSMLYGIRDFYPRFGYATAGPDHLLHMGGLGPEVRLPQDWAVRDLTAADLPGIKALYAQQTMQDVGSAVRDEEMRATRHLNSVGNGASNEDACRVIIRPDGCLAGYVWWAGWAWYVRQLQQRLADTFVIGEAFAEDPAAADVVLDVCRLWAQERSRQREAPFRRVCLGVPPQNILTAAAMRQWAEIDHRYQPCGGSMARVLDVRRLLAALVRELSARWRAGASRWHGRLIIETDIGSATLKIHADGISLLPEERSGQTEEALTLKLPQFDLARLALGAFPPSDVLARLDDPPPAEVRELVEMLFPLHHPHMYLPDRY